MSMTYRPGCPIPSCNRTVSRGKLMCPRCWGAVPPHLQREVYRTWRAWQRDNTDAAFAAYDHARTAALEAV